MLRSTWSPHAPESVGLSAPLTDGAQLVRAANPGMMTLAGTNSWVIEGRTGTIVIDPGPAEAEHRAAIERFGPISAVVLTHRHSDHADALRTIDDSVPVVSADAALARGDWSLSLFGAVELDGRSLRIIRTPGHTDDSVCVEVCDTADRQLCTGDTLLGGRHASFISRVGGDLGALLRSLRELSAFRGVTGLPGHGPVIDDVGEHAADALSYRQARLAALEVEIARQGRPDPERTARERYPAQPARWPAAARMLEAELEYLEARLQSS